MELTTKLPILNVPYFCAAFSPGRVIQQFKNCLKLQKYDNWLSYTKLGFDRNGNNPSRKSETVIIPLLDFIAFTRRSMWHESEIRHGHKYVAMSMSMSVVN